MGYMEEMTEGGKQQPPADSGVDGIANLRGGVRDLLLDDHGASHRDQVPILLGHRPPRRKRYPGGREEEHDQPGDGETEDGCSHEPEAPSHRATTSFCLPSSHCG